MRDNAIVIPTAALRRIFIMLLVLILLIVLVLIARTQVLRIGTGAAQVIDGGAYQAVFLTNGSTYFGKLQQQGDDWFVLTEVFYLSVSEESGTQLIKRGSEPQGPREPMIIPVGQILFVENLREDGDVAVAIRQFKSGQLPVATPPPATPARTNAPTLAPSTVQPSPTR